MNLFERYGRKLGRMFIGFALIALGVVIAKQSYCLAPWNVLNDGIAHTFSITIGRANMIVGALVLLTDLLLRGDFGIGMLLNIWLVGEFTDVWMHLNGVLHILPKIECIPLQIVFCFLSITFNAFGIYFYMSARMGAGPRDTLIVFLTKKMSLPVGLCKLLLELTVFLIGWLAGGEIGIGTIIFVLCGGPVLQRVFKLFHFDVKSEKNELLGETVSTVLRYATRKK